MGKIGYGTANTVLKYRAAVNAARLEPLRLQLTPSPSAG
jgi:hypothetical protein